MYLKLELTQEKVIKSFSRIDILLSLQPIKPRQSVPQDKVTTQNA